MKKLLKYRNINLALHDKFMFGRNFVLISLSGKESIAKIQEAYDYICFGIIKSNVIIDGVKTNKLIIKEGKQYLPKLTRSNDGLLTIPYKQYDPRLLNVENGKLNKNVIIGCKGLKITYRGIELTIPKPAKTDEIHAFEGKLFDKNSYLIKAPNNQENLINLTAVEKNIILKSDEDFKLFKLYKDKLSNYEVNQEKKSQVNVYMTYQTFFEDGDETKITIIPGEEYQKASYLINVADLDKVIASEKYWFEVKQSKQMYVIDAEKQYRGVEYLADGYTSPINNSILIFEDIKVARKYRDYFKNNQIIINNDKSYKSIISNLGLHDYTSSIYNAYDNITMYNQNVIEVNKIIRKVKFEGENYYQVKAYYLNNLNSSEVSFYPGNIGGGYLFKEIPTLFTNENYELIEDEISEAKRIDDVHDCNKYSQEYEYAIYDNQIYKSHYLTVTLIFDMYIDGQDIVINVFNYGYRDSSLENEIKFKGDFEVTGCKEYKFFSKFAPKYAQNFKTVRFKNTRSVKFSVYQGNEKCVVKFAKHLRANIKRNGLYITAKKDVVHIKPLVNLKLTKYEKEMSNKHVESYLFMDRGTSAGDNGEHIYRHYLHNDKSRKHYYILSKESADWDRLSAEGFNLIEYLSDEHKELFLTADKIITSHLANRIFNPFFPSYEYNYLMKSKIIFLQHGITIANHRGFLDRYSTPLDLFICGAVEEQEQVQAFSEYSNVQCTGFARFDRLRNERAGYILYAPSWNTIYRDKFVGSEYHKQVQSVLENDNINNILVKNNMRLKLLLHPEFIGYSKYFSPSKNVDIIKPEEVNYNKFISEADMLITDYSSLYFDFLYQEKQVILHQPYKLHNATSILKQPEYCVRKTYDIDQLVSALTEIEQLNFESDKKEQILKFFGQVDKNNCVRIMNEIEKL